MQSTNMNIRCLHFEMACILCRAIYTSAYVGTN